MHYMLGFVTAVQLVVVTLEARKKLMPNPVQLSEYAWATAWPDDHLEHVRVSQPTGEGTIDLAFYVLAADPLEAASLAGGLAERMTRTIPALRGVRVQSIKNLEVPGAPQDG